MDTNFETFQPYMSDRKDFFLFCLSNVYQIIWILLVCLFKFFFLWNLIYFKLFYLYVCVCSYWRILCTVIQEFQLLNLILSLLCLFVCYRCISMLSVSLSTTTTVYECNQFSPFVSYSWNKMEKKELNDRFSTSILCLATLNTNQVYQLVFSVQLSATQLLITIR